MGSEQQIGLRGNTSLVKIPGENLGTEGTFMAMTPVPVNAEMSGQVGGVFVSCCISWFPKFQLS